jgi:hypothetical protein
MTFRKEAIEHIPHMAERGGTGQDIRQPRGPMVSNKEEEDREL